MVSNIQEYAPFIIVRGFFPLRYTTHLPYSESMMAIPLLQEFQTLRQGTLISVLPPERSCYDLIAFRQLPLPEADFIKTAGRKLC